MKKSTKDLINDLLEDKLDPRLKAYLLSDQKDQATVLLEELYEFNIDEFQMGIVDAKPRLEKAIGCSLTDEQLKAISGGKMDKDDAIFVGVAGGATGAATVVAVGVAISILIK